MNISISFCPELRSKVLAPIGQLLSSAYVRVASDDLTLLEYFAPTKVGYAQAERFMRLLERGYSPDGARWLSRYGVLNLHDFMLEFDKDAHTEFPVPFIPETCVSAEDVMFSDALTPAEIERLYAMWLKDGDEIFHFESAYFDDINIPQLLSDFRALAQGEDDKTGDWTHSHHSDVVQY